MKFPSLKNRKTTIFKIVVVCAVLLVASTLGTVFGPPIMLQVGLISQTAKDGQQKENKTQEIAQKDKPSQSEEIMEEFYEEWEDLEETMNPVSPSVTLGRLLPLSAW